MLQRYGNGTCSHIIELLDSCSSSSGSGSGSSKIYWLLFPLFPRGTVWDVTEAFYFPSNADNTQHYQGQGQEQGHGSYPFDEEGVLSVCYGAACALAYLHLNNVSHRDMKPHNILITHNTSTSTSSSSSNGSGNGNGTGGRGRGRGRGMNGVVMDLGSCNALIGDASTRRKAIEIEDEASIKTSAAFRAPELTQTSTGATITGAVDVWALGCTLYCTAFGMSPFENNKEGVLRLAILNGRYSYPSGAPTGAPGGAPGGVPGGGGGGGGGVMCDNPLIATMPPPLPTRTKQGEGQGQGQGQGQGRVAGAVTSRLGLTYSMSFIKLIDDCLQLDPKARPTAQDCATRIAQMLA